jgi:uncharacterized protein (DUF58 family)
MLSARGWWFLLLNLCLLTLAIAVSNPPLALLCLTLLCWFLGHWLVFASRVRLVLRNLRMARQLRDERGPVESLWAGQTFAVRVQLRSSSWLSLPYLRITDRLPLETKRISGEPHADGAAARDRPLGFTYRLHCPAPGQVRFEGLEVQVSDLQGFFHHTTFLTQPRVYRVLPPLSNARGQFATVKRHNIIPLLGGHRHRRPGSGSELLDLREYLPGDPPKTIAWKVSARRDRLMTKEFESIVPIRCTLFVDTSNSVRVGPVGKNALTRLVEIASAVAQASIGHRDLTGLCLFDEHTTRIIRPARSSRHLLQLLNTLAEVASLAPTSGEVRLRQLLPRAYGFAREVYPDLMRHDLNQVPWWLPWLWPQPGYTIPRPTLRDRLHRGLPWYALAFLGCSGVVLYFLCRLVVSIIRNWGAFDSGSGWGLFAISALMVSAIVGVGVLAVMVLLSHLPCFYPRRRKLFAWRKRLAALLAVHYQLPPGALGLLLEDDVQMNSLLQRFLAEHQVPYPLPFYDPQGRYLFAAPSKVEVLARSLLRMVSRGRDNELFVLLADLLELGDHLGPLLKAVKVARARHHQIMVICPWPPRLSPPRKNEEQERRREAELLWPDVPLERKVTLTTARRFHRAFHQLRRTFARLGVPVICAKEGDPVQLILDQMERLRVLERGRP